MSISRVWVGEREKGVGAGRRHAVEALGWLSEVTPHSRVVGLQHPCVPHLLTVQVSRADVQRQLGQ